MQSLSNDGFKYSLFNIVIRSPLGLASCSCLCGHLWASHRRECRGPSYRKEELILALILRRHFRISVHPIANNFTYLWKIRRLSGFSQIESVDGQVEHVFARHSKSRFFGELPTYLWRKESDLFSYSRAIRPQASQKIVIWRTKFSWDGPP